MPGPTRPFNLTDDELTTLTSFLATAPPPPDSVPSSPELLGLVPRFGEFMDSVSPAIETFALRAPNGADVLIVTRT